MWARAAAVRAALFDGWLAVLVAACGGTSAPPPPTEPVAVTEPVRAPVVDEQARRDKIASAHRVLEEQQSVALASSCDQPAPHAPRCAPSCYAPEPPDPRATAKKLRGAVEIQHLVCATSDAGPFAVVDELGGKLAVKKVRGRFPAAHKAGSWEADVEAALALHPPLPKGDVIRVTGRWKAKTHPITKERLRCVTVSRYTRSLRRPLDACGGDGAIGCEASGDAAAHGLNVIHFRVAEARALQAAGKSEPCQQAALEALAVARGMPRWRQYAQLNANTWKTHAAYRTRFDGVLDEDGLFAAAAALGAEAEQLHAACGGAPGVTTTAEHEQSFHGCW